MPPATPAFPPPPISGTNASTASEAAATARQFANEQFQRNTESREQALLSASPPWRERVELVLQDFLDFHGYFRAGYGRDDQGGPQVAFQAPGAFAKYRLGNEAENYGELTFGKDFYVPNLFRLDPRERPDGTPSGPIARVQATLSIFNPYRELLSSGSTDFGLPEAWASIGNVVATQPSMKFWAGSRYYRRHDIHINDFFFYNMSGTGGGVEDLELPFGDWGWPGSAPHPAAASATSRNRSPKQSGLQQSQLGPAAVRRAACRWARASSAWCTPVRTAAATRPGIPHPTPTAWRSPSCTRGSGSSARTG